MRVLMLILLVCVLFALMTSSVSASSLEDRFSFSEFHRQLEEGAHLIIVTVRAGVAVLTVLIALSVGVTLWLSRDAQALEIVKVRIFLIFIGLMIVFLTEPIVRFVLYIIGGGGW